MDNSGAKSEVSESVFEYLLAEVLAIQPPDVPEDEQVSEWRPALLHLYFKVPSSHRMH